MNSDTLFKLEKQFINHVKQNHVSTKLNSFVKLNSLYLLINHVNNSKQRKFPLSQSQESHTVPMHIPDTLLWLSFSIFLFLPLGCNREYCNFIKICSSQ